MLLHFKCMLNDWFSPSRLYYCSLESINTALKCSKSGTIWVHKCSFCMSAKSFMSLQWYAAIPIINMIIYHINTYIHQKSISPSFLVLKIIPNVFASKNKCLLQEYKIQASRTSSDHSCIKWNIRQHFCITNCQSAIHIFVSLSEAGYPNELLLLLLWNHVY